MKVEMMSHGSALLYPTRPTDNMQGTDLDLAALIANLVLSKNGMEDFLATQDRVKYWKDYFIFQYHNVADPTLAYGGGATLVVRKSDFLGGMVYCSFNWLEEDIDQVYASISEAFIAFDAINS